MIKLRFVASSSLLSLVIRATTWADFSHVDLVVPEGLLGARATGGVKIRPVNYYTDAIRVAEGTIDCNDEVANHVVGFCTAQLGKPYDYSALFGNLFHRDWHEPDSWFCSELIAAAFDDARCPIITGKVNRVTPKDLAESPLVKLIIEKP